LLRNNYDHVIMSHHIENSGISGLCNKNND